MQELVIITFDRNGKEIDKREITAVTLLDVVAHSPLVKSRSDARRLIKEGAVSLVT